MPTPLAVLIVEDVESDALFLVRLLEKADYDLVYEQVETAEQMRAALQKRTWDIVISDYSLPQFNGYSALTLLKETGLDIPFIIVSGTIDEQAAVALMKAGAQDYLMKDKLARLIPTIKRELEQAGMRRKQRQYQEQLLLQSSALNAVSSAIVITDREGTIEWVNPAFNVLTGYEAEEAIGKNPRALYRSGTQDQAFYKNLWDTILSGSVWHGELINRRKDGSLYVEEQTITPLKNADGTISYFIAVKQDISPRRQAETALQESEERFRKMVATSPDGIALTDLSGYILLVNMKSAEMHGYEKPEDMVGLHVLNLIVPEDRQQAIEFSDSLSDGDENSMEYTILRRDGSTLSSEIRSSIIHDAQGGSQSVMSIIRDITARKQAEESLRKSEERHRTILQTAMDGFWMVDLQGRFLEVNTAYCRMSGYSEQELLTMRVSDVEDAENPEEIADHINRIITLGEDRFESRHRRKDGSVLNVEVSVQYRPDEGGRTVAFLHDITQRKQAEDRLRNEQDRIRTILDTVGDPIFVKDNDHRIVLANRAFNNIFGLDENAVIGKTLAENVPVDEREHFLAVDRQVLDSGIPDLREETLTVNDVTRTIITRKTRFIEDTGKKYLVGSIHDITERKQAEKNLRESEEKFRSIIELSPVPYALNDEEQRITYLNAAFIKTFGYTLNDIPTVEEWWPKAYPDAEYRKWAAETWQARLDKSKSENAQFEPMEVNIHCKDGSIRTALAGAGSLTDAFYGVHLVTLYDITDRKQAEKALRDREEQYRTLIEQLPAIVFVDDAVNEGRTLYISPQIKTTLGFTPQEWQERSPGLWSKQVHPEDLERVHAEYMRCFEYGEPYDAEYRIYASDGRLLWFRDQAVMLRDEHDKPSLIHGVIYDITERKQAEENLHQRVTELEMLHQSGLALSQLLDPKEIGQKILELLQEKLGWQHTRIRLYHSEDDRLELLDFNQPGLMDESARREVVARFQTLITRSDQGLSGWATKHGQPVRLGDVTSDPRYIEAFSGIHSGLYVPMRLGDRIVGGISIEDEQLDAFSEEDERLIVTLANQAASAFENARLFEETRQRVLELETLNRISLILRTVSKQDEMLSIVLDEALAMLNTAHGSIMLHNKAANTLEKAVTRGWTVQLTELSHAVTEGIAGKVFTSGETYITHEFASDPETRAESRSQIPFGWGGICLPIRTTLQTLGVLIVSVPSEHELTRDEIRLLSILSEMTGATVQRIVLYEQTIRRLEQLNTLRAVEQTISSSRDMRITLNMLLTNIISQLGADAADVLLLQPGSSVLELVANLGFHKLSFESINLSGSFAGQVIMEHRSIVALDFENAALRKHPEFARFWMDEGFVNYWCVPLIVKGEVKGVLEVYRRTTFTPDEEWLEFLMALVGQATIAIENTQLFENLQRANLDLGLAYDATIEGWSRAMDLRDHETEGHTLRVTDLTLKLARAMRINQSQLTAIRRGALLHDIGKIGISDSILLKEGALTDEEWMLMRKHPQLARDMLLPIAYLNDALEIPYWHHEKWDGTGYPQGLRGEHIPLAARIFAVVDVWDALTNDRPYRRKWTKPKTIKYIKEQSGKHFDPRVVEVFLQTIKKK